MANDMRRFSYSNKRMQRDRGFSKKRGFSYGKKRKHAESVICLFVK